MKILFLSAANDIHTVRWVNELSRKNHDVTLIFCKNHAPTIHKIDNSINLIRLPFNSGIGYYLNSLYLKRVYKKITPDVVNVHYASGYGTLARISRMKKMILSVWGSDVYDFPYESSLNMSIVRKNIKYADEIASTSYVMANQVRKLMNDRDMQITITPFGVDTEKFKFKNDSTKGKNIEIGIVKKLKEKYGIEYLIKAFKIVIEQLKKDGQIEIAEKVILKIYGDGEQKSYLEELCKTLYIDDKVKFMGSIPNDEVAEVLGKLDIFALSSILDSESFGVAAVEAMSVGISVVATDVDGFKEVVENNVTGLIVERKNENALAEGLIKLILDEKSRNKMGIKGRERVEKLYTFTDNVDEMIELYNRI